MARGHTNDSVHGWLQNASCHLVLNVLSLLKAYVLLIYLLQVHIKQMKVEQNHQVSCSLGLRCSPGLSDRADLVRPLHGRLDCTHHEPWAVTAPLR